MKPLYITLTIFMLISQYAFSEEQQAEHQSEEQTEQQTEKPPEPPPPPLEGTGRVIVTISQDTLTVGVPFTITLLVDYPEPEDVEVITSDFSSYLKLEHFEKSPIDTDMNLLQQATRKDRNTEKVYTQTSLEFIFIASNVGRITLDPFTIASPHGARRTSPIVLVIHPRAEVQRINSQRLIWEGAPRQIPAGERVTFYLRFQNLRPENIDSKLSSAFFMPQVPRGVILSQSPVSSQEKENGIALKLTMIPLTEGNFNLPARSLHHTNVRYDIAALSIRITAPPAAAITVIPETMPENIEKEDETEDIPQSETGIAVNVITQSQEKEERNYLILLIIITFFVVMFILFYVFINIKQNKLRQPF